MSKKSVLVIFGNELPNKGENWWRQFESTITSKQLETEIVKRGLDFINLDDLVEGGVIKEAYDLVNKISRLTLPDGRRISNLVKYRGYELWWIHYEDLFHKFCIPYTRYRKLIERLNDFDRVTLYKPPAAALFLYSLEANRSQYKVVGGTYPRFPRPGVLFQALISFPFLLWLAIRRPRLMLWTSDQFYQSHDFDFRLEFIYKELRERKISFVEFIRSQENFPTTLAHAWRRRRPVIYSAAVIDLIHRLAGFLSKKDERKILRLISNSKTSSQEKFWLLVATHYLRSAAATIWSVRVMKFFLKTVGAKAAIVPLATSRNFHEVLGCKLLDIKTVGVQHGVNKYNIPSDFMPEYDGEKILSVDKYGLWSEWWKDYYLKNSRAYRPEQLYISGPMRPLRHEIKPSSSTKNGPIKVLFVAEQLAVPSEVMPYLLALLGTKDIFLSLKFRSYRDGFEEWLKENHPEILDKAEALRVDIHEAITQIDVVVGSHSTAVLEALFQLKPPIFFSTKKWGDYFELKDFSSKYCFFVENPRELISCVKKTSEIPKEVLKELQERFFGDPYKNGSKWAVEQVKKFL